MTLSANADLIGSLIIAGSHSLLIVQSINALILNDGFLKLHLNKIQLKFHYENIFPFHVCKLNNFDFLLHNQ